MNIEILGSGGSIVTPRPGCSCLNCVSARINRGVYVRTGPSVFIHDYSLIIDTPEDIVAQLNRSNISGIEHCLYSHWHGDHVLGRRVWYSLNYDFSLSANHKKTKIFLSKTHVNDFENNLGHMNHLRSMEKIGLVEIVSYEETKPFFIKDLFVQPIQMPDASIFGFSFQESGKKIIVIMDDMYGWEPNISEVDLAILPVGIFHNHPISNNVLMAPNHPILLEEATFDQTLQIAVKIKAKNTIFIHIEEHDRVSPKDLEITEEIILKEKGLSVKFAYDQMLLIV